MEHNTLAFTYITYYYKKDVREEIACTRFSHVLFQGCSA